MLDTRNQGPQCTVCGSLMTLTAIEPGGLGQDGLGQDGLGQDGLGQDLRTFTCPKCENVERHIIDSAVTEVWLEPQRAIQARH
jgi:hypothetical protein